MAAIRPIVEETVEIAGIDTFIRRVGGKGTTTLFVHGNPTHSGDWLPFLKAMDAPAVAIDLPNFGHSERLEPDRFDSSMHAYAEFVGAVMDELMPERFNLVAHDWGGIALKPAAERAERISRLVLIDVVPLLAGFRWHWIGRLWRRRLVGEFVNATMTMPGGALVLRQARPRYRRMPEEFVRMVWDCWDPGMGRAVLRLYRSADPGALEAAGAHIDRLRSPALVLWGRQDPYVGPEFAHAYAERLHGAEAEVLDDAGHWPWIDRPDVVPRVAGFLAA